MNKKIFLGIFLASTALLGAHAAFAQSVPQTGCPSRSEVEAIPNLAMGANGDSVRTLQRLLACLGYEVPQTGYYGTITSTAVRTLQEQNGITGNGGMNFGPQTRALALNRLGSTTPPPPPPSTRRGAAGIRSYISNLRAQGIDVAQLAARNDPSAVEDIQRIANYLQTNRQAYITSLENVYGAQHRATLVGVWDNAVIAVKDYIAGARASNTAQMEAAIERAGAQLDILYNLPRP